MSERFIRQQLPPPERQRREQFRHVFAAAQNAARHFDGTEAAYQHLMNGLLVVEDTIRSFGFTGDIRTQETEAVLRYNERHAREIDDLLTLGSIAQARALSLERKKEDLPYAYTAYAGVFLQPGTVEQPLTGEGKRAYEVRFDTIVNNFLTLLREYKIFADDVIVTIGQQPPSSMMRQESYVKVEIPRIAKTVLLCNQVGEATFVIQGHIPDAVLSRYTKEDLQNNPEYSARKVIRGEQWQAQLLAYLFQEDSWGEKDKREKPPRTKVDVKELVTTRERIIAEIHAQWTPEKWVNDIGQGLDKQNPNKLKFNGKGLDAIARLFGVSGDASKILIRLQLGAAIWPESAVFRIAIPLEMGNPQDWRKFIEAEGWTPERWVDGIGSVQGKQDPSKIKFNGKGLDAIGGLLNIKGTPKNNTLSRLRLGAAIWPESTVIQTAVQLEARTPEDWRKVIVAEGWTPERWVNDIGSSKTKQHPDKLKIDGKGLTALTGIFGVDFLHDTLSRLQLGAAIWPESLVIRTAIKIEQKKQEQLQHLEARTPEDWRKVIVAEGWTPERWVNDIGFSKTKQHPDKLKIDGKGLTALAGFFGVDFLHDTLSCLRLGAAIWPESAVIQTAVQLEARTPEDWRKVIVAEGWTPERWVNDIGYSKWKIDPLSLKFDGRGLVALARLFGTQGEPNGYTLSRLQLGLAIWPDSEFIKKAIIEYVPRRVDKEK